ncbi:MAG: hypothetical protein WBV31_01635, partial [Terriglobales bacterium]
HDLLLSGPADGPLQLIHADSGFNPNILTCQRTGPGKNRAPCVNRRGRAMFNRSYVLPSPVEFKLP